MDQGESQQLFRDFPDPRDEELASNYLYERIAKDVKNHKLLFRCAVEPFWDEVAAEVRKNYKPAARPRPKKKAKKTKKK